MKLRFTQTWTLVTCAAALAMLVLGGAMFRAWEPASPPTAFREIQWHELTPKDWDPIKRFRENNRGELDDSDPYAQRMMQSLWDNAPTVADMDGAAITGYELRAVTVSLHHWRNPESRP